MFHSSGVFFQPGVDRVFLNRRATAIQEDRRKRASIRYRQIMQDPESPAARAIRQAQAQMMSQVPPNSLKGGPAKDTGLVLHAPQARYPTPEERDAKLKEEAAKASSKDVAPKDGG